MSEDVKASEDVKPHPKKEKAGQTDIAPHYSEAGVSTAATPTTEDKLVEFKG